MSKLSLVLFGSETVTFLCPCECRTQAQSNPIIPAPVINIFVPTEIGLRKSQPWLTHDIGSIRAAEIVKVTANKNYNNHLYLPSSIYE